MAVVRVTHGIGDLASDMRKIETGTTRKMTPVVRRAIREGNALARGNARGSGKSRPPRFAD